MTAFPRPTVCRDRSRDRQGSVPLVAATFLPLRSASVLIGESFGTTSAVHSGREKMYGVRVGVPFASASSGARPADDPMSMLPAFRYSSARLLPALNTHLT